MHFVGYPSNQKGYKCFDPISKKFFVSMDVKFFEGKCYQPDPHLQGESRVEDSNATNSILTIDAFQEETGYADFKNAVF